MFKSHEEISEKNKCIYDLKERINSLESIYLPNCFSEENKDKNEKKLIECEIKLHQIVVKNESLQETLKETVNSKTKIEMKLIETEKKVNIKIFFFPYNIILFFLVQYNNTRK